jgi:hypothetical protein
MALAGRSSHRDGGRRLLVAGLIITLVVLVIDASLKSRSPNVAPQMAASVWLDRVLPIIQESTTEGQEIDRVRSSGVSSSSAQSITAQVSQVAAAAQRTYQQLVALHPPDRLAGAAGLLEASLLVRSQAAGAIAQALTKESGNGAASGADPEVAALTSAGQELQLSDRAYSLFAQRLPDLGVKAPASTWVSDPSQYDSGNVQAFLTDLGNAKAGNPVHQLTIASVTLTPSPLNTAGGVEVLVPTNQVTVSVVVANTGTERENLIAVQASIAPSAGNAVYKQVISLPPGAAYNAQLGPLNPPPGAVVTLTISVTPPPGSPTPTVTKVVTFMTNAPTAGGGSAPTSAGNGR